MRAWIGSRRAEAQLERPVRGHLDLPVVERGQAVRHLDRGVVPVQHLEAQVGGAAAAAGDHVLGVVAQVGVEVQGVRVVQAHLGVRAGGRDEVREVALVGPGQLERRADVAGQIVVAFGEILLGLDVRGAGDDRLGFEQRVSERLGEHPHRLERVLEIGQCRAGRGAPGGRGPWGAAGPLWVRIVMSPELLLTRMTCAGGRALRHGHGCAAERVVRVHLVGGAARGQDQRDVAERVGHVHLPGHGGEAQRDVPGVVRRRPRWPRPGRSCRCCRTRPGTGCPRWRRTR